MAEVFWWDGLMFGGCLAGEVCVHRHDPCLKCGFWIYCFALCLSFPFCFDALYSGFFLLVLSVIEPVLW